MASVPPSPSLLPGKGNPQRRFLEGTLELRVDVRKRAIVLIDTESGEDISHRPVFCRADRSVIPRSQLRRIRATLFAELPEEMKAWIVRMRFPWLTFQDIARLWKESASSRWIAADNARLLPLWLCLPVRGCAGGPTMISAFKNSLRKAYHVAPTTWRALCRYGWRLFPAWPTHANAVMRRIHVHAYLRVIGTDAVSDALPPDEKRHLWQLATHAPVTFAKGGDLARAVLRHVRAELSAGRPVDAGDLACIVIEIDMRIDQFRPDANQRRAGWRWWLRQWQELDDAQAAESDDTTWACPVDAFAVGEHIAVPLRSTAELRNEGRRMRNCLATLAGDYANRCMRRSLRLYSIRHSGSDGPSKATVSLAIDGLGRPLELEANGYANRDLPARLTPIVEELLHRYENSTAQLPLARARRARAVCRDESNSMGASSPSVTKPAHELEATVSVAFAIDEMALATLVRERVRQHVIIDRHTILLLARRPGGFVVGSLWPIPVQELALARRDARESSRSTRSFGEDPACLVVPVPDSITAVTVRAIIDNVESGESPRAVIVDASGQDAAWVAEELEALPAFLGIPILVVSTRPGGADSLTEPVRTAARCDPVEIHEMALCTRPPVR